MPEKFWKEMIRKFFRFPNGLKRDFCFHTFEEFMWDFFAPAVFNFDLESISRAKSWTWFIVWMKLTTCTMFKIRYYQRLESFWKVLPIPNHKADKIRYHYILWFCVKSMCRCRNELKKICMKYHFLCGNLLCRCGKKIEKKW